MSLLHIQDSTTTHACDAADAEAGVLTYKPDVLRLVCKERNAQRNATDTEEKELLNKGIVCACVNI